jgi:hypothetical protein
MQLLCSSSSLAFVHSLRIALEGEGIESYCSDAETTSMSSIAGPIGSSGRVYVLHEKDWDRAVEIMRELSGPTKERITPVSAKPLPVWLVVVASAVLVALLAGMLV